MFVYLPSELLESNSFLGISDFCLIASSFSFCLRTFLLGFFFDLTFDLETLIFRSQAYCKLALILSLSSLKLT